MKTFSHAGRKMDGGMLNSILPTVRYRLDWESRSPASQGADLQRRMATKLLCRAVCLGVTTLDGALMPQCLPCATLLYFPAVESNIQPLASLNVQKQVSE